MQISEEDKITINEESPYLVMDTQNKRLLLIKTKSTFKTKNEVKNVYGMYIPESSPKSTAHIKQIIAANFIIKNAEKLIYKTAGFTYHEEVVLECETNLNRRFTVKIDVKDFNECIIKSALEKQAKEVIFSADITSTKMNKLLFNLIRSIMTEHIKYIPLKPGFWLNNNIYSFISHNTDNLTYETDTVSEALFDRIECTENDCAESFKLLKFWIDKNKVFVMLAFLNIASFLYTPFKNTGYGFNKLIAVTGCDSKEKLDFITDFFKVFERGTDELISLNITENSLKKIIFSRKDEMIVFDDDSSNKSKLSNRLKILYDCFVNRKSFEGSSAECNGLIICSHAHTMELLEEYAEDLIWIDLSNVDISAESIDRIIAVKKIIQNTLIEMTISPQMVQMYCNINDYNYNKNNEAVMTLSCAVHTIELLCDSVFKIKLNTQGYVDTITDYVSSSEGFFNPDKITEDFRYILSHMIEQGEILFENKRRELQNLPVTYIKGELLLFNINDFAKIEQHVPFGLIDRTPKSNGIRLRSILREKGYLVTNNGDKLLYKTSVPENSSDRMNFVALKKSFLTSKAQSILPTVTEQTGISSTGYIPPDNNDGKERIILGNTTNGYPVYWSIGNSRLSNKHLYIQADSGSGKTTLLFLLAQRLHKANKKVIILDFAETASYSEYKIAKIDKNIIENTGHPVFENGTSENDIRRLEFKAYNSEFFTSKKILIDIIRCKPVEAINILRDTFNYLNTNNQNGDNDIYVILDEINSLNFDEKFSENNDQTIADVIFRQGRSIGLNLISATQFLSNKGSKNKALLFNQSATKIALRLNGAASTGVAKSISFSKYVNYKELLENLDIGQAIVYSGLESKDNNIRNDFSVQITILPLNQKYCPPFF